MLNNLSTYLKQLQHNICQELLTFEKAAGNHQAFIDDPWENATGAGLTRAFADGKVFDRAAINFSHVSGNALPPAASHAHPELTGCNFHALGVSVVIHPVNPYVPTTHANVRFFMTETPINTWWFGGGFDLTPYYGFVEDCQHWHQTAANACASFGTDLYQNLKQRCDEYFYLPHRKEARGIGGIFFDDYNAGGFEQSFAFMQSVGNNFITAYMPIVAKRQHYSWGKTEKHFQALRRGRYVEFNLLYDRGTRFGIESNGRAESILLSLPPEVNWQYNWQPEPGSPEARLYTDFLPPRDWLTSQPEQ